MNLAPDIPYSIYIHIPFCKHRCAYCDFNTYSGLEELIPGYVNALCKEIEYSGSLSDRRISVHTIYLGGGTPSLLDVPALQSILTTVKDSFWVTPQVEITLEANPGTLSLEYLSALLELGINRLSLGMQSANPDELRLLERQHGLPEVYRAVYDARRAGFTNLNLDLIYGLPNQKMSAWKYSVEQALLMEPDHLSLYALTLEHGTPMARWAEQGLISVPDPDLAADMYEFADECLANAGYRQYEISNWARVDEESGLKACRHNLQYWRSLPYLGFGAGAHGYANGIRTMNALAPKVYIQRLRRQEFKGRFPVTPATLKAHQLTQAEEISEFMIMGLRLIDEGVQRETFEARFGQALQVCFGEEIEQLIEQGLLEWRGSVIRLTRRGRLLGNRVFQAFV